MSIHLIKLSVGPGSLSDLEAWQQKRLKEKKRSGEKPELMHITRNMPRRTEELLEGGSIYWVIKGWICARQRLIELRPITYESVPHCGIVYDEEMIRVKPRHHRPFQGWRYLDPKAAPADLPKGTTDADLPDEMSRELAELGLL